MRKALWLIPLFALLAVSLWYAATTWSRFETAEVEIPFYGYMAIAGGVVMSLLVGGGLMALVFYSSRHGYDDLTGGDGDKTDVSKP